MYDKSKLLFPVVHCRFTMESEDNKSGFQAPDIIRCCPVFYDIIRCCPLSSDIIRCCPLSSDMSLSNTELYNEVASFHVVLNCFLLNIIVKSHWFLIDVVVSVVILLFYLLISANVWNCLSTDFWLNAVICR